MPVQDPNTYLQPEVAAKFEVIDWPGKAESVNFGRFGDVNLRTLTVAGAESLVKRGFRKLRRREAAAAPKAEATTKPKS